MQYMMMLKLNTSKKPAREDWHSAYIVYQLRLKGLSLRRLSRLHGYSVTAASLAVYMPWPKMERLIAEAIGVPPQTIWPSRYGPNGKSNRRMGGFRASRNASTAKPESVIQPDARKST